MGVTWPRNIMNWYETLAPVEPDSITTGSRVISWASNTSRIFSFTSLLPVLSGLRCDFVSENTLLRAISYWYFNWVLCFSFLEFGRTNVAFPKSVYRRLCGLCEKMWSEVFVKKCMVNGAFLWKLTDVQANIKFNCVTTLEQSLF